MKIFYIKTLPAHYNCLFFKKKMRDSRVSYENTCDNSFRNDEQLSQISQIFPITNQKRMHQRNPNYNNRDYRTPSRKPGYLKNSSDSRSGMNEFEEMVQSKPQDHFFKYAQKNDERFSEFEKNNNDCFQSLEERFFKFEKKNDERFSEFEKKNDERFFEFEKKNDERLSNLEKKNDERLSNLEKKNNDRFQQFEERLSNFEKKNDERFSKFEKKNERHFSQISQEFNSFGYALNLLEEKMLLGQQRLQASIQLLTKQVAKHFSKIQEKNKPKKKSEEKLLSHHQKRSKTIISGTQLKQDSPNEYLNSLSSRKK